MDRPGHSNTIVGWREWISLPGLGVPWLKAKIDTGARTSAIHAFDIEEFTRDGADWVRFAVHPWQRSSVDTTLAEVPVHDRRRVRSSSGHATERIVIRTAIELVGTRIHGEVTLARRDQLGFRMLIGREALRPRLLVDPGRSYLGGRPPRATRRRNRGR